MNNTTIDTHVLLKALTNKTVVLMIPAFVYLAVLIVAGITGNILICFYYGYKSSRSSNTVFIVGVAMYDLILCIVSIPVEIVDITFFYNFQYSGPCKFMRSVTYFAAFGSVFTLLAISFDRFRKICRPFKKQIGVREAKIACGISVLFSTALSWPAAVFFTSVPVDILTDDDIKVQGFKCTTTRDKSYKMYLWIFNGFCLLFLSISFIILFVMYGFVGRRIYKHNKSQVGFTKPKSSYSCGPRTDMTDRDNEEARERKKISEAGEMETHLSSKPEPKLEPRKQKQQNTVTTKTVKCTKVMIVIVIVFVLSFLPHLALSLWRSFQTIYGGESLTDAELVAFEIGLRSYFLNSAINPLIYGFFNLRFRAFFCLRFCPCCKT